MTNLPGNDFHIQSSFLSQIYTPIFLLSISLPGSDFVHTVSGSLKEKLLVSANLDFQSKKIPQVTRRWLIRQKVGMTYKEDKETRNIKGTFRELPKVLSQNKKRSEHEPRLPLNLTT